MPYYQWIGVDLQGNIRKGAIFAKNMTDLDQTLFKREIALLKSKQVWRLQLFKPKKTIFINFFKNAALLLRAGMHIQEVLEVSVQQMHGSIMFQKTLNAIVQDIKHGTSLAQAFGKFPAFFDTISLSMMHAGQEGAMLAQAFESIAQRLQLQNQLYAKLRSALLLPCITFGFFVLSCLLIFTVIIPSFSSLFVNVDQLPLVTKALLSVSSFLRSAYFIYFLIILLIIILSLTTILRNYSKKIIDQMLLKIPFIKNCIMTSAEIAYLESLSLLIGQGVHISRALSIAKNCVSNNQVAQELIDLEHDVRNGMALSKAMNIRSHLFSIQSITLTAIGEESGNLGLIVGQAATGLQEQLSQKITVATSLIQPMLMLFLGLMVAALIFALYVPLFNVPNML